jgi:N-acetylglucosamine kinase-like BadF-type ATPase
VAIFLGIDGGGSKTSCLIGDETSILGAGTAGASNPVRVGEAQARDALTTAIRQACAVASITPSQIKKTCVGLAGAARPEISGPARLCLAELVAGEIEVVGDMVIALEAAFGGDPGVIVIAGTGSIAYGRNSKGQTARAGGWGFAISDEGSGQWIGRAAVAATVRALDLGDAEGSSESLLGNLMKFWQVETREQLVVVANSTPAPDFSALFPVVLAAADRGDRIALDVLNRAGAELAGLARTVIGRLFSNTTAGGDKLAAAMSGGVFSASALVRQVFYNHLRAEPSGVSIHPNVIEPVRGALALARKSTTP